MKNSELLKEQSGVENTESSNNSNLQNTEYKNTTIGQTPIVAREFEGKWIGTVGRYKATENFTSYEELEEAVENTYLQWEDVGKIIAAQSEYVDEQLKAIWKSIEKENVN